MTIKEIGVALALGVMATASQTSPGVAESAIHAVDTDHDGTIDLKEAERAAVKVFRRLERDHDNTLDARELRGRIGARELAAADPDHDRTLTKREYLTLVRRVFKAADKDNDGTLDARELHSRPGRELQRLIR